MTSSEIPTDTETGNRDERIVAARRAGASVRDLAAEHYLSSARISQICKGVRPEPQQAPWQAPPAAAESPPAPFRVFLGWDSRQAEPAEVARFSLLANATVPVEVMFLSPDTKVIPGGAAVLAGFTRTGVTQFSYLRFLVPNCRGYSGRALFVDGPDTLILGDVAELADMDMGGKAILRVRYPPPRGQDRSRGDTSVMLMDCARCACWTPEVVATASDDRLMRLRDFADDDLGDLPTEWNAAMKVGEEPGPETRIAHWGCIAPLCPPDAGDWIDYSRSAVWAEWRERMRAER
jgi:hypothetical protein